TWDQKLDRTLLCKEPVFSPADLNGMKLRMFQSRIPVLSWETLGADIQIIPWAATYTALATGTVDCITARVEAHHAMRQTEVAKYITITKEYFQVYAPLISQHTADRLSDEQIAILQEAAFEAGEWFSAFTASMQSEFEETVKNEDGVSIIEPPLAPWQDKIRPAYATFETEGEIPAGIVETISAIQ
ncbi:MAG: TRAP transporter substrate-binding protein DctP, partial [Pseudomonadales bacterium]|nr:TRAP transporter substrate-binding protein DctP [Pseudomonadales bacterium]